MVFRRRRRPEEIDPSPAEVDLAPSRLDRAAPAVLPCGPGKDVAAQAEVVAAPVEVVIAAPADEVAAPAKEEVCSLRLGVAERKGRSAGRWARPWSGGSGGCVVAAGFGAPGPVRRWCGVDGDFQRRCIGNRGSLRREKAGSTGRAWA